MDFPPGPLKTATKSVNFGRVHLLSNNAKCLSKPFAKWLGCKPEIHEVSLQDPTDYEGIFQHANQILQRISSGAGRKLNLFLSPGTPAMAVVWVLLGKTRFPATLLQARKGGLDEVKIPDTFFNDLAPELLRDRDAAFQSLALQSPSEVEGFEDLVGNSPAICQCVAKAKKAAVRDVSILLLGETGTGKEMFAQAIHKASSRRDGPFRAVNCAAIPGALLESELFGHKKGAFTGAERDRKGLFEEADNGTLFLDEIGECPPQLQSKLLRILQPPPGKPLCHREFSRIGESVVKSANVRIIAATNRDLSVEMEATRFREDLYYRLATITIFLPPLRERKTDIPLLAEAFLRRTNLDFSAPDKAYVHKKFSLGTIDFIKRHDWPGNVRELNNAILQAVVMTGGDTIERPDLAMATRTTKSRGASNLLELPLGGDFSLEEKLDLLAKHYLERAMEESDGVKTLAAKLLGLKSYQAMDSKLKSLNIRWKTKR